MVDKSNPLQVREEKFNKFIVSEYLRYGSVDEVFGKNDYNIPISYPQFHRVLDKWGIVKSAGPNSKLSEAICFMVLLSDKKISVEKLYRSLPPSYQTSLGTLHRLLHNVKEGIVRRVGTALVITSDNDPYKVLVGQDVSTPRLELGKPFGSISLPMGYSKKKESSKNSILRVLQQEVFTENVIDKNFPVNLIPEDIKPFMYFDIVDIKVAVYNLSLTEEFMRRNSFTSFKLINHRFMDLSKITNDDQKTNFRYGIKEIIGGYQKHLLNVRSAPIIEKSEVNLDLAQLALEYVPE